MDEVFWDEIINDSGERLCDEPDIERELCIICGEFKEDCGGHNVE
jgi:hypothetical protein